MAQRIYCNRNWKFSETFKDEMINESMEGGEVVNIPHTTKETPFSYFDDKIYQMVSCYQKTLFVPIQWEDKVVDLIFEGVGHEAVVYVNGKLVAHHNCGYTAIKVNVSDLLRYGEENLITVRVDSNENLNQPPFGFVIDYMTFGGIYRDVYFEVKDSCHIKDVFLMPSLLERIDTSRRTVQQIGMIKTQGILKSKVTVSKAVYEYSLDERVFIRQYLDNQLLFSQPLAGLTKVENGIYCLDLTSAPTTVGLWDIESPRLYKVKTEILLDDDVVDSYIEEIGFRSSEFKADGYYLNGRKVRLRGLNRHQSYPYVGYAMPESMQRYDAKILKEELGLNAVRTSHYPQSHYFINECDKLGLLVFTEMPGWQHIGNEDWKNQAVENTRQMVLQYRNHPSIILWGVRINESPDDDEFYERTNAVAHEIDPTRPTGGVRCIAKSTLLEDVYTYNDFVHSGSNEGCQPKEKVTSNEDKAYLISEYNGHMYPTKMFDWEEHRREHAMRHARVLDAVAGEEDIAGSFGWCMFDYNTHKDFGSGDRICYHGVMDMFRNPKLAAAIYACYGSEPVLELSSSFDIGEHPACNRGETYIVTNADSVKMYKNDRLIKEYFPEDSSFKNLEHGPILIDDYIGDAIDEGEDFKRGQAKLVKKMMNNVATDGMKITPWMVWAAVRLVVIYHMNPNSAVGLYNKYVGDWGGQAKEYRFDAIKDGKVVKSVTKVAATNPKIKTVVSHTLLTEQHTYDVAEIRLTAVDSNDNQLFFYNEPIEFQVEGPIEIIGPSTTAFRGGASGVYIKSLGEDGDGKLTIKSNGLEPVEIGFSVEKLSK